MKMNVILPVVCALLLGYLCASFIFEQYGVGTFTFDEKENVYFLQCGAYTTKEASDTEIKGIEDKITVKEGEKYYSYIGMTSSLDIANDIKDKYQKQGIEIYVKEEYLDSIDFINQLTQYDVLLRSSDNLDEINSVLKTVLATYDEIILSS